MNSPNRTLVRTLFAIACAISAIDSVQAQDPTPTPSPTPPAYSVLDLGTLYGVVSGANAINNSADVVGYATANDGSGENRAFLYSGGIMIDLGTLQGGNSVANAINNLGDIIGDSNTTNGGNTFIYSNGTMTNLGILGSAFGINDSSQIVGEYNAGNGYNRAFVYSGGTLTDLGTLGGNSSRAYGINKAGDIVGQASTTDSPNRAFLYSSGIMSDLGTLGGTATVALAINDTGLVVGYAYGEGESGPYAFLYANGSMANLGTLGGSYSYAHAINNAGQVVGYSHTSDNMQHAFLYSDGVMYDLNTLCSSSALRVLFDANGINDLGQIAATGYPPVGDAHAFLLRPITATTTGQTVSSPLPANSSYVTVSPVTNSSSVNNTTASLIGGEVTSDTIVNITFTDGGSLSGFQAASDVVNVSGTGSDVIVLQLSYNETEAINTFGSEPNARLVWLDPGDQQWKLAVAGNTGGTVQFVNGAYDPAQDFHLGYYGVDTVNNVVWAVINHNSDFTTGNRTAVTQPANADLKITVTDGKMSLAAGAKTTYSIVVTNRGPEAVIGAVVADTLPLVFSGVTFTATPSGGATGFTAAGSGNINDTVSMPVGSKIIYKATGKLSPAASGTLSNTATITPANGDTDPNMANNSATDSDGITLKADLRITVSDGKTTVAPGAKDTYTVTVINGGPSNVSGAGVQDNLPDAFLNATYTASSTTGASGFTASGGGNINDTVDMPAGSRITYKIAVTIDNSASGSISNTASVAPPSGVVDPNTANNTRTDTDTL